MAHPRRAPLDDPQAQSGAAGREPRPDGTPSRPDPARPTASASSTGASGSTGSADRPSEPPDADEASDQASAAPGLLEQLGRTRGAATRLIGSHVELAKSELGDIVDEVKRLAMFGGIALGVVLLVALLLVIGLILFIGETLFGSLGWGVLHGTLLLVAITAVLVLVALRFPAGPLLRGLGIGVAVGVIVAIVLGLDLTNRAWTALGDAVAGPVSADIRPLVVAVGVLGVIGAVVGLLLGARGGGAGSAIGGLFAGLVVGALLGALTALAVGPRVGAAIGVTVALLVWLALIGREVASRGIDVEGLKARLTPRETIDTTKETIEWVREQAPLGRKS